MKVNQCRGGRGHAHASAFADNAHLPPPLWSYYKSNVSNQVKASPVYKEMARYNDILVFSFLVLQFAATLAQVDRTLQNGVTGDSSLLHLYQTEHLIPELR